jgi:glycosyltransferase involved in cell wall biosynthesis
MELAARRPDIRLLVVEGAAKSADMPKLYGTQLGIGLAALTGGLTNVTLMPNDPDARKFYRRTKILLMPSLVENAGLVASEAMMNGIPVIASNRGGLPETVGEAGILIDIPSWYTPKSTTLPTAEEVEPWIAAIQRLWDDAAEYERGRLAGLKRAEMWRPERLALVYREFFSGVTQQPGPPIVRNRPPRP